MSEKQLADLATDVKRIIRILEGDPENRADTGLVGDVKDNTMFRVNWTKFIWVLVVSVVGAYGAIFAQVVIK